MALAILDPARLVQVDDSGGSEHTSAGSFDRVAPRATILSTRNSPPSPAWDPGIPGCPDRIPGQSFTQAITCSETGEGSDRHQQCRIGHGRMSAVVSTRSRPVRSGHSPEQAGHGCHATGPLDRALADDCLHSPGIDGHRAPEVLEEARALLTDREYQKAATILEDALTGASPSDRGAMILLLRQSYQGLVRQAEAAGKAQ